MTTPKTIEVPEELLREAAGIIDILTDETYDKDFRREAIITRKQIEAVLEKAREKAGV